MADIVSRVYRPNAEVCCEACVFGKGPHANWCGGRWISEQDLIDMPAAKYRALELLDYDSVEKRFLVRVASRVSDAAGL